MKTSDQEKTSPIVRFAVQNRVTMSMIVVGVMVLGWVSLQRLPLEYLPTFSSSNITVSANYPSSSPAEIERRILQPLEESLGTINNIETLSANARANSARVNVRFLDGTDMDMAAVDVRDRVERVRHLLPSDLRRVNIRRFQTSDIPVIRFDLSADWERERLYEFAEEVVQRRLERVEGVAQVEVEGVRSPQLQINLDPARMQAQGIDLRALNQALRNNNVNLSAGEITEKSRKLMVRVVGEFASPGEVARMPINDLGLKLRDVAEVVYAFPQQEEFNFLNGQEAVTVEVNKTSTSNLLAVVTRIKDELTKIEALPAAAGVEINVYSDTSRDVVKGLGQLRDAGLIGGALAIVAVFLFIRRFRTTLLVAIAIPVSVVASFVILYLSRQAGLVDITLNVISLAGLMLALGMLVDNSIVVIESIFRHRNELGRGAFQSALSGASEVALPIIASTVTTMCVFLPLIFLGSGGRFQLYFTNLGLTVCIVMIASLLVALTVVPMSAAIILGNQASKPAPYVARFHAIYGAVLRFSLRHRFAFSVVVLLLLAGTLYEFTTIERSFSSRQLEREVIIRVGTPRQYTVDQTRELYEEIYGLLDERRDDLDIADISYTFDRGTGRSRGGWGRSRQINLYLLDEKEGKRSTKEVQDEVRKLLPKRAGVDLKIATGWGRYGSSGVEVELMGPDMAVLELVGQTVADVLGQNPMFKDVDTSLESGDEEVRIVSDRDRALRAGLSSQAVAFTVNNALSSRAVSQYKTGDREVDLIMQYRDEDRETLDQLKNVPVFSGGARVPLSSLADFDLVPGPRSIERENHMAKVSVTANTASGRASFAALGTVEGVVGQMALPPGYSWSLGRWNRFQRRDSQDGTFALLFALPLVYMILAALFESYSQPLSIMFSVPFAAFGVLLAMKWANQPWDNTTMMGMVLLLGIVVNNAIVLIDHINTLRKSGMSRDDAIVEGGKHRLRPIVITAVTTILGMLPMVAPFLFPDWFGPLEGRAASWAPIGLVIVGGLTTSTFLTLVIIPTVYSLIDDAASFLRSVARSA